MGFVLLDQLANFHHQLQVRVFRGNGEDVGAKRIVLSQTFFQIFQLWQDKQIVRTPM